MRRLLNRLNVPSGKAQVALSYLPIGIATMFLSFGIAQRSNGHEPIPNSFVQGPTFGEANNYDYGVAAYFDGKVRAFWTSGFVFGDFVMRSEASTPWGKWSPRLPVFGPTNTNNVHDGAHTADPTVIKIGQTIFLYYTGHPKSSSPLPQTSSIGTAWSWDNGKTFSRVFDAPTISVFDASDVTNEYGCGQPVAIWIAPWVYLFYSDSTAPGSNPTNGGGVYCIRSRDAFFQHSIEELTATGFVPRPSTSALARTHSLFDANSVDVQWISSRRQFVMLINGLAGTSSFRFFDQNLRPLPQHNLDVPGINWTEGGGFLRTHEGHALPHGSGATDRMSLVWFYPYGENSPWSWDVAVAGIDIRFTP